MTIPASIFAAFALSGVAGLMHQVVWARLLVGLIGATAHAQASVLGVFMGGLALGAVVFGRRADRLRNPLRTYVILEMAIAVYCLLLPLFLRVAAVGYFALARRAIDSPGLTLAVRFALASTCVLLPAVLMGGTLPVLARRAIHDVGETRRQVGKLYALNSLGAVAGAGLAGFLALPLLGVHASLVLASLLNVAAGGLVWGAARREASREPLDLDERATDSRVETYTPLQYGVTLAAVALSGFAAMGYEVLFTRVIALAFGSSTHSFTVMLMCFIAGISLGSAVVTRMKVKRPLLLLGSSQLLVVVALCVVTPLVSRLPYLIGLMRIALADAPAGFALYQLAKAGLCLGVLLLPTTCLGFCFPLVAQVQARSPRDIGTRVGTTYAWNTAGNVLGAVLTALVLIPGLGLLGSFHLSFALNALAGLSLLAVCGTSMSRRSVAPALAVLAVVAYGSLGTGWLVPLQRSRNHLRMASGPDPGASAEVRARHPSSSFAAWKHEYVDPPNDHSRSWFEEDAHASAMAFDDGEETVLYVNTKADASTRHDLPTQMLLAHAPMFSNPGARSLLVIGHGSGITAGSATRHPVERVDVVEISNAVLALDHAFADYNYHVLDDPRVHVYEDDARGFLESVDRRYDVIVSEPTNPWIAGVSDLFTVEFYERLRDRLAPHGVAAIWLQQYRMSTETVQLVLRTLNEAFPYVDLWRSPDYQDLVAVASARPLTPDFAAMEERFDEPAIRNDFARIGVPDLASFLIHHTVGQERTGSLLPPGARNTVGHPLLEYVAARDFFDRARSSFLRDADPLLDDGPPGTELLLDRYAAWRESVGDPLRPGELEYVAARSGSALGGALRRRASPAAGLVPAAARPARGGQAPADRMGPYEAAYWWKRNSDEGRTAEAEACYRRFAMLEGGAE